MSSSEIILCLSVPLVAIILSFITRKVSLSLGVGILLGLFILYFHKNDTIIHCIEIISNVLLDSEKIKIILFTILISLMVHVMILRGHIKTIAIKLMSLAKTRKSAQLLTWTMGMIIFFDDYANTLIIGNTLKPITDRFRISREKLAYIVDSTAAPVAAIALISTWIGVEVSHIDESLPNFNTDIHLSSYGYFLNSLSYSYYPILTLAFILITILSNREFGPMLRAKPVYSKLNRSNDETNKLSLLRAIFPIAILLLSSIVGMIYTGYNTISDGDLSLIKIVGEADIINSLLVGATLGFLSANRYQKNDFIHPIYIKTIKEGFRKIADPLVILIMAWVLGEIIKELDTGECIASLLPSETTPYILPGMVFLTSALVSFSTGSSFSTMGIMYKIALPLTVTICLANDLSDAGTHEIIYHTIACVLAGAVFGDHCSPISDTTVLSSLACDCNHLDHVKTQMPYAMTVGGVSIFISLTIANTGMPALMVYGLGILFLYMIMRVFGRTVRN